MKMLAVKRVLCWQWVVRRDARLGFDQVVSSPCKAHALGANDLEYFQKMFPEDKFMTREVLE